MHARWIIIAAIGGWMLAGCKTPTVEGACKHLNSLAKGDRDADKEMQQLKPCMVWLEPAVKRCENAEPVLKCIEGIKQWRDYRACKSKCKVKKDACKDEGHGVRWPCPNSLR